MGGPGALISRGDLNLGGTKNFRGGMTPNDAMENWGPNFDKLMKNKIFNKTYADFNNLTQSQ